jgi:hypothetical protein
MRFVSRAIAVMAAFLALLAQPVLAQDLSKGQPVMSKAQSAPAAADDRDAAKVAEARRLTAEVLSADAAAKAHNEAELARYNSARASYAQATAEQRAAQARYDAELAAQRAAVVQYEADKAAWEARVKACQAGHYDQCEQR